MGKGHWGRLWQQHSASVPAKESSSDGILMRRGVSGIKIICKACPRPTDVGINIECLVSGESWDVLSIVSGKEWQKTTCPIDTQRIRPGKRRPDNSHNLAGLLDNTHWKRMENLGKQQDEQMSLYIISSISNLLQKKCCLWLYHFCCINMYLYSLIHNICIYIYIY